MKKIKLKRFALIELLVVVGTIVFLISMTAPAMHSALRESRSIGCKSNLRQIYLASSLYGADTGYYMQSNSADTDWTYRVSELMGNNDASRGFVAGPNSRNQVIQCPESESRSENENIMSSYSAHGGLMINSSKIRPANYDSLSNYQKMKFGACIFDYGTNNIRYNTVLKRPAEIMLFGDSNDKSIKGYMKNGVMSYTTTWNSHPDFWYSPFDPPSNTQRLGSESVYSTRPGGALNFRHIGTIPTTNVIFCDGHSGTYLQQEQSEGVHFNGGGANYIRKRRNYTLTRKNYSLL